MKHHYHIKSFLEWFKFRMNYQWRLNACSKLFEELGLKNIGAYHDLYIQSGTLLLADIFENLWNKCIEIYEIDPIHFLSAPALAWQAYLKKTRVV